MKKGRGKAKGGAFERLICKKLSLWWTDGEREDVFFRTSSSGGRATQRSKQGKKTFGQYGDIQAADPIGQPLMDLCVIECKDGYAGHSIADLLDKIPRHKPKYEEFIIQARQSRRDSEVRYWMLIARRRGRQIMVYMPFSLWLGIFVNAKDPPEQIWLNVKIHPKKGTLQINGTRLDMLLEYATPQMFKDILL